MKNLFKAIAVASLATTGVAQAMEGSVSVVDNYTFRGGLLAENASIVSAGTNVAGLDFGIALVNGDDDYHERNLMVGYSVNLAGMDVDLGYTNYSYGDNTALSPNEEDEISVSVALSGVTVTYVDGDASVEGQEDTDFSVLTFGYTVGGMDFTVGEFDTDGNEYNFYEISTGTEVAGLDASVTLTNTFSEENGDQDAIIAVSLGKSLSL